MVVGLAVGLHDGPVGMFLKQLTLRIDHLRLYPDAKLHTCLLGVSDQSGNALGQLSLRGFPVAETRTVVLAGIFVGKPAVVEQEEIHAQVLGILHQLGQRLLVEVEARVLPVVEEREASLHALVHLILARPVVEVARSLAHTMVAQGEDKLGRGEDLASLELIVGGVGVDGGQHTEHPHIVHLKGEAEVARPSNGASPVPHSPWQVRRSPTQRTVPSA